MRQFGNRYFYIDIFISISFYRYFYIDIFLSILLYRYKNTQLHQTVADRQQSGQAAERTGSRADRQQSGQAAAQPMRQTVAASLGLTNEFTRIRPDFPILNSECYIVTLCYIPNVNPIGCAR
jgi:hypothetical protein